jgi:hypothetical protein
VVLERYLQTTSHINVPRGVLALRSSSVAQHGRHRSQLLTVITVLAAAIAAVLVVSIRQAAPAAPQRQALPRNHATASLTGAAVATVNGMVSEYSGAAGQCPSSGLSHLSADWTTSDRAWSIRVVFPGVDGTLRSAAAQQPFRFEVWDNVHARHWNQTSTGSLTIFNNGQSGHLLGTVSGDLSAQTTGTVTVKADWTC